MIVYPYNNSKEKLELLNSLSEAFEQGYGNKRQLGELEELLAMMVKPEEEVEG